jgi:cbb3-type cytochrome oxidase cytochrome c subunit
MCVGCRGRREYVMYMCVGCRGRKVVCHDYVPRYSYFSKKNLKIPKGYSESVSRRRTDNTMTKRKRTNNDLQKTTQKAKD